MNYYPFYYKFLEEGDKDESLWKKGTTTVPCPGWTCFEPAYEYTRPSGETHFTCSSCELSFLADDRRS